MICLGFDTSNYTTSVASYDGQQGINCSRLLPVEPGALGLRQSEALFSHVKRLPELSDRLFAQLDPAAIRAVGVSTRPRAVEGSYMPCFLAGESQARVLASALHVPLYCFSHQQGHIAAVLWSAGRMDLLGRELLAWHLSGGTTELLLVRTSPAGDINCEKIGGSTDISAGQLIDRTGQLLGLDFPAGKALDLLASQASGNRQYPKGHRQATGIVGDGTHDAPGSPTAGAVIGRPQVAPALRSCHSERSEESVPPSFRKEYFKVKVNGCEFSLSGVQNQVQNYCAKDASDAETAYFALRSVVEAVKKATKNAQTACPLPVIFSGGVASNSMLRRAMPEAIFGAPQYSTDNAAGIAVLTWLKHKNQEI